MSSVLNLLKTIFHKHSEPLPIDSYTLLLDIYLKPLPPNLICPISLVLFMFLRKSVRIPWFQTIMVKSPPPSSPFRMSAVKLNPQILRTPLPRVNGPAQKILQSIKLVLLALNSRNVRLQTHRTIFVQELSILQNVR